MTTNDEQEEQGREVEIRERADKATAPPWEHVLPADGIARVNSGDGVMAIVLSPGELEQSAQHFDADFIAHSREDVPWLLDRLDSARTREAALRSALEWAVGWVDIDETDEEQNAAYQRALPLSAAAAPAEADHKASKAVGLRPMNLTVDEAAALRDELAHPTSKPARPYRRVPLAEAVHEEGGAEQ